MEDKVLSREMKPVAENPEARAGTALSAVKKGVLAVACGVLVACSGGADVAPERADAADAPVRETLLTRAQRMFDVRLFPDGNGHLAFRLVSGYLPTQVVVCSPQNPQVLAGRYLGIVQTCLKESGGPDLKALLEESVNVVNHTLVGDGLAVTKLTDEQRQELVRSGRELFRQELKKRDWFDLLAAGWKEHIEGKSECARRLEEQFAAMLPQVAESQGIRCDVWENYLGFCTAETDDVADHVVMHMGFDPPQKMRLAIETLMKAGLVACMARIIEQDAPELAEEVRGLRASRADGPDMNALNARAWELWRRRGVEQWLEQVAETGELPEELRVKIALCGGGRLPPVVGQGPGGETPAPPGTR